MARLSFEQTNSRDTILHKVKDQAYYKSGIMSSEYPNELLFYNSDYVCFYQSLWEIHGDFYN
jgi:hypothetical protein